VTNKTDAEQERYIWQCLEGAGTAMSLTSAVNQALCFLIGRIASLDVNIQFVQQCSYMRDWQKLGNQTGPD
jgi:hypothetical protein